jgi:ribosomal protein S18 acetylase RimI-like enzyme
MSFEIQKVSEYDTAEILPLIQKYFPYVEMNFDLLTKRIHHPKFHYSKSVESGIITGYAEWELLENHTARLNGIVVKPNYRKKGHAQALLEEGENFCKEKKIKKIILLVAKENTSAKKLYEKNNYCFSNMHLKKVDGKETEVWEKAVQN